MYKSAKTLARTLKRLNQKRTWRDIEKDFPGVSFGTLDRIAKSNGQWTPKRSALRVLLNLPPLATIRPPRRPRRVLPGSPCAGCKVLREFRAKCKLASRNA